MNFFSLLAALLLGYHRPQADWLHHLYTPYAGLLERSLNDGQPRHGVIAWLLGVLLPALAVGVGYVALLRINPLLGMAFSVGVLYLSLRFDRFGNQAEAIAA